MEEIKRSEMRVTDTDKLFALVSYILFLGILIYRNKKDNEYVLFHSKQGIVLFGLYLVNFILMAIPFLVWLIPFLYIAVLILFFIGADNALSGKMTKLPFIGQCSDLLK
jgi:fumarate reductase subunit D